jgi:uncharacterized protein GlcG (DUF336 family)
MPEPKSAMTRLLQILLIVAAFGAAPPVYAQEAVLTYKSLAPDAAFELARVALQTCRSNGYQIAVVVMDRFGEPLVMLRDRFVGLPAPAIAANKAYTALSFRMSSGDFAKAIQSGQLSGALANTPRVVTLAGGLLIEAAGSILGSVGVAGAPGGDKDEECARAGLDVIRDELEF